MATVEEYRGDVVYENEPADVWVTFSIGGTWGGGTGWTEKSFLLLDLSFHFVTSVVEPDSVIVEEEAPSSHTAKFERRDGMNRSLFTNDVDMCPAYYTPFMTFWIETTDTPECLEKSLRNARVSGFVSPEHRTLAIIPDTMTFGVCSSSSSGDLNIS